MARRIAGKIFSTPEEAGLAPLTETELADARKPFDEARERIASLTEADRWTEVPKRFRNDTSGTEYEGWRDRDTPRDPTSRPDEQSPK